MFKNLFKRVGHFLVAVLHICYHILKHMFCGKSAEVDPSNKKEEDDK